MFLRQEGRWALQVVSSLRLDLGCHISQVCSSDCVRQSLGPSPVVDTWGFITGPPVYTWPRLAVRQGHPGGRQGLVRLWSLSHLWLHGCASFSGALEAVLSTSLQTGWHNVSWVLSLKNFSPLDANIVS